MSKYTDIFNYLKQCPQLYDLWSIYATEQDGANVILPFGTSQRRSMKDYVDNIGGYNAEIMPYPSVYEEFQINCYRNVTPNADDFNVLNLEDVQAICDWIIEQDENGNLPYIEGKQVVSIEPFPFNPQIRGIDPDTDTICYYITVRITYVNNAQGRCVEYEKGR